MDDTVQRDKNLFLQRIHSAASPARLTQWSEELSSTAHDWDRRRWEQSLFHSLLIFFLLHLVDTIGGLTLLVICPKGWLSGWYFSRDKRIVLKWWLTKDLVLVFPVWCGLRFRCLFALWLGPLSASRNSTLRSKRASPVVASWISRVASFRQSLPILHSFLLFFVWWSYSQTARELSEDLIWYAFFPK